MLVESVCVENAVKFCLKCVFFIFSIFPSSTVNHFIEVQKEENKQKKKHFYGEIELEGGRHRALMSITNKSRPAKVNLIFFNALFAR